jgi:hypothetical protein
MYSDQYPPRYLHIVGAFAAGGVLSDLHPSLSAFKLPVHAVAPVHLPMAGGTSEAKASKVLVHGKKVKFGKIDRKLLNQLKKKKLISMASAYSLAQTGHNVQGQPFTSKTVSEIKTVQVCDDVTLKYGVLNLESSHDTANSLHPHITFGKTDIVGLKLGKYNLKLTIDVAPFNQYPTLEGFENAFNNDPAFRAAMAPRMVLDRTTGGLHKNPSGYVVGSIVKSVTGLPPDATLDGFIIDWPKVGKIVLGEVLMGPYVRRVTLLRLKKACTEYGSGCSGGSTYP